MKELSLNVLDIVENSVKAEASCVNISLVEDTEKKLLEIVIEDDGRGMDAEFLSCVTDPFTTTRTTRKVGLGIPLFKDAAEMTGGSFKIESEPGKGTAIRAVFNTSHLDFTPVGDMAGTFVTLVRGHPDTDFVYRRCVDERSFEISTAAVRDIMGDVPLCSYEVISFLSDFINQNTEEILGGL